MHTLVLIELITIITILILIVLVGVVVPISTHSVVRLAVMLRVVA
jgi:hypothetical protein